MNGTTAAEAGLLACRTCGLLLRPPRDGGAGRCVRCGAAVGMRKHYSIGLTWALIAAAGALYVPANVLPVFESEQIGQPPSADTILSGALRLWLEGAWPLAVIIVVASIVVPLGKLVTLAWLLATVRCRWAMAARRRAALYRLVDFIGRWSMVDLYVGALLVSLVQFQPFTSIHPGPGAAAFGAVVVLTILASRSFDPRLIWDAARAGSGDVHLAPGAGRRHG